MIMKVGSPSMKEFKGLFLELSRQPKVRSMCIAIKAQFYIAKTKALSRGRACRKGLNQVLQGVQDIIHSL